MDVSAWVLEAELSHEPASFWWRNDDIAILDPSLEKLLAFTASTITNWRSWNGDVPDVVYC